MRNPQPTGLRTARTVLTTFLLALLIWFGISQTQRDNQAAFRHAPVVQPSYQFKQSDKESSRTDNQDDYVSKVVGVATFIVLLVQSGIFARQAALMRRQTDIYDRQAGLMQGQLDATTKAANAAHTANVVSRESLIANRRPWVPIAISIGQRGLYFDVNGVNLHLTFTMRNTGETPAAYVQIIGGPSLTVTPNKETHELERICTVAKLKSSHSRILGTTIFPGETQISDMVYTFAEPEIISKQALVNHGLIFVTVLGCVDYASTFDDTAHHQSRFIFELILNRAKGNAHSIKPEDGDIPYTKLVLRRSLRAGSFYAD